MPSVTNSVIVLALSLLCHIIVVIIPLLFVFVLHYCTSNGETYDFVRFSDTNLYINSILNPNPNPSPNPNPNLYHNLYRNRNPDANLYKLTLKL